MIRVQGSESFRNAPSDDSAISPSHLEVKGPFVIMGVWGAGFKIGSNGSSFYTLCLLCNGPPCPAHNIPKNEHPPAKP